MTYEISVSTLKIMSSTLTFERFLFHNDTGFFDLPILSFYQMLSNMPKNITDVSVFQQLSSCTVELCYKKCIMTAKELLSVSNYMIEGEPVTLLQYNTSTVHVLGTSHLNPRYVVIVRELIQSVNPQVVGVELCRTRLGHRNVMKPRKLKPSSEFNFEKIPENLLVPAVGEKLRLMYVYGSVLYEESKEFRVNLLHYRRMKTYKLRKPTKAGVYTIGAELLTPFKNLVWHADNLESKYLSNTITRYKILLLDRPVEDTFSAMANVLTANQKELIKYYKAFFETEFLSVDRYKRTLMHRLWLSNPTLRLIFVNHRDEYMARTIVRAIKHDKKNTLVCIVGKSHLPGLMAFLTDLLAVL